MEKLKCAYPVIAVVGPTASGKTALAIELAKLFDGEIISCDSMQVYRGMDIGTAKADEEEKQGIPHHMLDVADPGENYSCADYAEAARAVLAEVQSRGKLPIFCGGTGLYLDAVLKGTSFSEDSGADDGKNIRETLEKRDRDDLYEELLRIDPAAAEKTHKNNVKRVIRALEIYYKTGMTKTEWDARSHEDADAIDAAIIGLDCEDREVLYERINRRVNIMLEKGLVDEVKGLKLSLDTTAGQAIGYKEILWYLNGDMTLSEAAERIRQGSRNYAKRQLTWFRRNGKVHWICTDREGIFENIVNNAVSYLTKRKICDIISE